MTHATPDGTADEKRDEWWVVEDGDGPEASEADGPAPTADRFRITDMQHWIDLSA